MSYSRYKNETQEHSSESEEFTQDISQFVIDQAFAGGVNPVDPGGSSAPGSPGPASDGNVVIQNVAQGVLSGVSPLHFMDAINAGNRIMGNRDFLRFVGGLHRQSRETDSHDIARAGLQGIGHPLTHLDTIQQAFGHHDVSGMREHLGPVTRLSLAALGAKSYASHGRMAFADTPDLYTQTHEAAHGVQQAALGGGLQLKGGIGEVGDKYEQHADAVAAAVVRGESAEGLLDQVADCPATVTSSPVLEDGLVQMMSKKKQKKQERKLDGSEEAGDEGSSGHVALSMDEEEVGDEDRSGHVALSIEDLEELRRKDVVSSLIKGMDYSRIKEIENGAVTKTKGALSGLSRQSVESFREEMKQLGMRRSEFHRCFGHSASSEGEISSMRFLPSESTPGHHDNLIGLLLVKESYSGNLTIAARYPVVSFRIDGEEYIYLRGYAGRLISLGTFHLLMGISPNDSIEELSDSPQEVKCTFRDYLQYRYKMNLHSRNVVMALSQQAVFYEAKHAMLRSPTFQPVDARAQTLRPFTGAASPWWGDFEINIYPVPGTIREEKRTSIKEDQEDSTVGFPQVNLVYYKVENKFIIYAGEQHAARGFAPGNHEPARFISGPIISIIQGVKYIELLGPEYAPGARPGFVGRVKRVWKRVQQLPVPDIRQEIRAGEPVEIIVVCQDGSRHRVEIIQGKVFMNLENRGTARGPLSQTDSRGSEILNKGKALKDFADVNTYSYDGVYTGVFSSPSGIREPQLIPDTQETLPVDPLIAPEPGQWRGRGYLELFRCGILEFFKSVFFGRSSLFGQNWLARVILNQAVNAAVKTAWILFSHQFINGSISGLVKTATYRVGPNIGAFGSMLPQITTASLVTPQFWPAIFAIVVIQIIADKLVRKIVRRALPEQWSSNDTFCTRTAMPMLGNWLLEFIRLLINFGILSSLGFRKHLIELPINAVQASTYALIRQYRESYGNNNTHPWAHWVFDLMQYINDLAFRALGNTLAYEIGDFPKSPQYSGVSGSGVSGSGVSGSGASGSDLGNPDRSNIGTRYAEAVLRRFEVRFLDKLGLPTLGQIAEQANLTAKDLEPFEAQHRRIYQDRLGLSNNLSSASVWVDRAIYKVTPDAYKHLWFHLPSYGARSNRWWLLFRLKLKLIFNRRDTLLTPQDRHITALMEEYSNLDDNEKKAFMETHKQEFQEMQEKTTYTSDDLDSHQLRFFEQYTEILEASPGVNPDDGDDMVGINEQQVTTGETCERLHAFDRGPAFNHLRKARAFGDAGKRTSKVRGRDTTFSDRFQLSIMEMQKKMRAVASLKEEIHEHFPGPENANFRHELNRAVSGYTVESGFFHLPLRYPHTGQPKWVDAVGRIKVPYTVLNLPDNVTDEFTKQFDPISAVHINLALRDADKFPFLVFRGVHTMAGYRPDNKNGTDWPEETRQDWRDFDVKMGDIIINTEMLSTSASNTMAKNFSMAIDLGMTDMRRRLKLLLIGDTAVNITKHTALNQAEALYTPGAQFRVTSISGTARDLGQVVSVEQVDTYREWELGKSPEGIEMDSGTGMLTKNIDKLDTAGRTIIDPQISGPKEKVFFSPKNYFLGHLANKESERGYGLARWLRPYDALNVPRGTRDAIHAAFLRGDHILKLDPNDPSGRSFLDLGTENIHHEYYRNTAVVLAKKTVEKYLPDFNWKNSESPDDLRDFRESNRVSTENRSLMLELEEEGRSLSDIEERLDDAQEVFEHEKRRERKIREVHSGANQIAALLDYDGESKGSSDINTVLDEKEEKFIIWLVANVLRREVKLIDLGNGGSSCIYSVSRAYDRVNLTETHKGTPQTPFVIGVLHQDENSWPRGYYSVAPDPNDQNHILKWWRVSANVDGLNIGNLLHAIFISRLAKKNDYAVSIQTRSIMPRQDANDTVIQLLTLIKRFSKFNYLPFKREMIEEHNQIYGTAEPRDTKEKTSAMPSDHIQLDRMLASTLQSEEFGKWVEGSTRLFSDEPTSPGTLLPEQEKQNLDTSLTGHRFERGVARGDRLQCFLDTVYQWTIGGRDQHVTQEVEIELREALNLPGGGMVEFDVTPTGILEIIAQTLDAAIHVYGINTNTGGLNHYASIGAGNNDYYLLHHQYHFEPLWPILA